MKVKSPIKRIARSRLKDSERDKLWAKSAGRCEFCGCNKILYKDSVTSENNHSGQMAHIVAFSDDGPRGDEKLSQKLDGKEENLMLLCPEHHHLIDKEGVGKYSVEILRRMKQNREEEIRQLTELTTQYKTQCIVYTSCIGESLPHVSDEEIRSALWTSGRFPNSHTIRISGEPGVADWKNSYWDYANEKLEGVFNRLINNGSEDNSSYYSVFALAPLPLLVKFGVLLGSLRHCDIYQYRRNPQSWNWPASNVYKELQLITPEQIKDKNVLIVSISAGAIVERVQQQLSSENCSFWIIKADNPNYDWVSSKELLALFHTRFKDALDDIRSRGIGDVIHTFMAMPNSCGVEMGRTWMPKADLPLVLYNLDPTDGQYKKTITIEQ